MDALTLLLIVDLCNRRQISIDEPDRPVAERTYTASYPQIITLVAVDKDGECYAYRTPGWMKL